MKRSKMLEIIEHAIEDCDIVKENYYEAILNSIEKAGMLPPKTELDNGMDKEAYMLGGNSDFTTADELRWEPEDEELDKES